MCSSYGDGREVGLFVLYQSGQVAVLLLHERVRTDATIGGTSGRSFHLSLSMLLPFVEASFSMRS
jgi:hypothetical protein